jgi:signal transduction histidine kinase
VTRRRTSLQRRLAGFFGILVVLIVLAAAVIGAALVNVGRSEERVTETLEPARDHVRDLYTAYLDQESSVRGYAFSGRESFTAELRAAERVAAEREPALREVLADDPSLRSLLDQLVDDHERWVEVGGDGLEAAGGADGGGDVDPDLLEISRASFDDVRTSFDELLNTIRAERAAADARAAASRRLLVAALLATPVVLGVGGYVLWRGLRGSVLAPVAQLGAAARRVSEGELDAPVTVEGPAELEDLGVDLEAMRAQIVTDLERVEAARSQLERTNAELEQFAYVASHDLQEPLRKVASFCQLLQKRYQGQLDERADEYIAFAVDGAKRMQLLITDLLDFSRVGRVGAGSEEVDLTEVASTAVSDLSSVIEEAGAVVIIGALPTVVGDRSLLASLYQNLVANAVKFRHPDRRARVELGARASEDGWELWCADNGIGIEPRHADRVFLVFQRLHSRDAYAGTGIGLALCRKIVEHHGGEIWIDTDDAVGELGTIVRWTLPASPADPDEPAATPARITSASAPEGAAAR